MNKIEIISASAGSGKTYSLSEELKKAVVSGEARPEAVVATTFTNRAAAELSERVRVHLLAAGRADDAQRLGAARIGTVNSVCGRLVGEFAFELGLSPRLDVLDENLATSALDEALSEVITHDTYQELTRLSRRLGDLKWEDDVNEIVHLARCNGVGPRHLRASARPSVMSQASLLGRPR